MTTTQRGLLILLIVFLLTLGGRTTPAQSELGLYFPETGHWVRGDFLSYYKSVSDANMLFGAPVTEAFKEADSGRTIQYFQKAQLILDASAPKELRVKQSPLGQELYEAGEAPSFAPGSPDCREFSFTAGQSYRVCYAFRDFFEAHGGLAQFGYPISNFEIHHRRVVQYFQNARFEWHPELPRGQHVLLGDLGLEYFHSNNEDPALLSPQINNNLPRIILSLKVNAFVDQPVMPLRGEQTLYVIVQDQHLQPISGANVDFTLVMPSGNASQFYMPATNEHGVTKMGFRVDARSHGLAEILVYVEFDDLQAETGSSFRIWW